MCGIAGVVHFNGKSVDPDQLRRMEKALAHRGPDGGGIVHEGSVGLAHRRLAIIDLSTASDQPMTSQDGRFTIVFNGEIYNFAELRMHLENKGYVFRSKGDTEVLLMMYNQYGEDCLEHLRGMFAFAILDRKMQTLFVARDRIGKKPFKWFCKDGTFAFASEERALRVLPQCPREIDRTAISHFLCLGYLPAPLTGTADLHKLEAAHYLKIDIQSSTILKKRYWTLTYKPVETTKEEWVERIRSSLEESVRLRMTSDVPLGAFLSGGIDSASVVAIMSKLSSEKVKTFSIGSDDVHSEIDDAEIIAQEFGTDHHPLIVQPDVATSLPELVDMYEEPFGDPSAIPSLLVARHARQYVTVAMSGDGGDENFGGYVRYPILRMSQRLVSIPFAQHLLRGAASLINLLHPSTLTERGKIFARALALPPEERILHFMGNMELAERDALFVKDLLPAINSFHWLAEQTFDARRRAGTDIVNAALLQDAESYLADNLLPKVDLASMHCGLEVRSPFLDHAMMEMSGSIPVDMKIREGTTKWIFREAMKSILPAHTLKKKKQGFRLPLDRWLRGELRSWMCDRLLTGNPVFHTIFDRKSITQYVEQYLSQSIDRSPQLWMLLWLEEWTQRKC